MKSGAAKCTATDLILSPGAFSFHRLEAIGKARYSAIPFRLQQTKPWRFREACVYFRLIETRAPAAEERTREGEKRGAETFRTGLEARENFYLNRP
jgi:hypothetical protein